MDRQLNFKLKAHSETGKIEGYASVYGNKDLNNDIVERGSFAKTLADSGGTVPLLYQHDMSRPVGSATLQDDAHGLKMTGDILTDIPDGALAYKLVEKGVVKGLSIGYRVVKEMWDDSVKAFRLLEIKLMEVSLVTIPANPETLITAVKNAASVEAYASLLDDIKAGRTLSSATRKRIETSISELQALLAEADAAAAEDGEPLKHSLDRLIATIRA